MLLNTHARAVVGKEKVMTTLTAYMDQISFTYDQTLRGIVHGMGPDELRQFVNIPDHFSETPENFPIYGESVHFPEAVYQYVIGSFDWDSTKLFKIAPHESALRTVELMGGKENVLKATRAALEKQEFAWAAELVQNLYLLDMSNQEVRQLKADILRQMAYRTTGSISRGFLLTDALALEGKIESPRVVLPSPEIIAGSPATFVDYYRIFIDPDESIDTDKVVEFVFTDHEEQRVALHVRRGIAEFVPKPSGYLKEADFVLRMDAMTWAELYLNSTTLAEAISSGKVKVEGEQEEAVTIFDMFDKFNPEENHKVPPVKD